LQNTPLIGFQKTPIPSQEKLFNARSHGFPESFIEEPECIVCIQYAIHIWNTNRVLGHIELVGMHDIKGLLRAKILDQRGHRFSIISNHQEWKPREKATHHVPNITNDATSDGNGVDSTILTQLVNVFSLIATDKGGQGDIVKSAEIFDYIESLDLGTTIRWIR